MTEPSHGERYLLGWPAQGDCLAVSRTAGSARRRSGRSQASTHGGARGSGGTRDPGCPRRPFPPVGQRCPVWTRVRLCFSQSPRSWRIPMSKLFGNLSAAPLQGTVVIDATSLAGGGGDPEAGCRLLRQCAPLHRLCTAGSVWVPVVHFAGVNRNLPPPPS